MGGLDVVLAYLQTLISLIYLSLRRRHVKRKVGAGLMDLRLILVENILAKLTLVACLESFFLQDLLDFSILFFHRTPTALRKDLLTLRSVKGRGRDGLPRWLEHMHRNLGMLVLVALPRRSEGLVVY